MDDHDYSADLELAQAACDEQRAEIDKLQADLLHEKEVAAALHTELNHRVEQTDELRRRLASVQTTLLEAAAAGDNGDGTVTITMSTELIEQMRAELSSALPPTTTFTWLAKHGWQWRDRPEIRTVDLVDSSGRMLAWIVQRPGYCDRGHYGVGVECVPTLDHQDAFPRFFYEARDRQAGTRRVFGVETF